MASTSLRSGSRHAVWSISRLDLEPVAKQDHDQRDDRESCDEGGARVEVQDLEAALAQREAGEHEQRRERQEAAAATRPETSAPATSSRPRTSTAVVEGVGTPAASSLHASRVAEGTREGPGMRITVFGKSPSWQDAGRRVQRLPRRGGRRPRSCSTAATACSRKLRTLPRLRATSTRSSSRTCTPTTSSTSCPYAYALTYAPRQQPVPVDRWPGTDDAGAPGPARARRRARRSSAAIVGALGQRGADRERLRRCASTTPPRRSRSARCGCASTTCRTS